MTCASIDSRPERSRRPSSRSTSARASFGSSSLFELLAKLADFLGLVVVAELFLNRLHLLAQEHLALALAELFLHLRFDLVLRLEQRDLALHVHEHAAQALLNRKRFEQSLFFRNGELDVARDEVGELAGLGDGIEHLMHDFLGKAATLAELGGAFANFLVERLERGVLVVERRHLFDVHHDGREIALALHVLERGGALLALKQQLDAAQAALDLADPGDDARVVEDFGARLVGVVALCDGEDQPVAFECGLDGPQGTRDGPPRWGPSVRERLLSRAKAGLGVSVVCS